MPTYFGQPAAENRWFGNELIIPPAELREPTVLVPVPVPEPPAIPLPQPLQYEQYQQADGGSGPNTGPGSAGNFSGYMTPATIDPTTGYYQNIGFDPEPSFGRALATVAALAPVVGQFAIPAADKAFRGPLSSLAQALGITEDPAGLSQEGLDVATSVEAPTGRERDDMFSNFDAAPAADAPSGRAASDAAKAASLAANPMQAVAWGAGTFGGTKDQIGLDWGVETGEPGPGASAGKKVICTALYHHGLLPEEVYLSDQAFGRELATNDPDVMRGYHAWASPIARLMRRCRTLSSVLSVLILPWAHEIYGNSNWLGRFYVKAGIPFCRWIGKRLRHRERPLAI